METPGDKGDLLFRNRYRIPSARRVGWDYRRNAAYFLTVCTKDRDQCFGTVEEGRVLLFSYGEIAAREWKRIPGRYSGIHLDAWIVMPDHLHGILLFNRGPAQANAAASLGDVMGQFKSKATKSIRASGYMAFDWQERFHDRIIRDADELERIRAYIHQNPLPWVAHQKICKKS